ncbi:U3 snoRNP protein [Vanrija albida]|uniref:U3 small nucleolar ribonucleoprotein protein MPP10 n=1 Tax=Vanrija albida TaxID=181172 RepID=A0ABR3Q984_9TREE
MPTDTQASPGPIPDSLDKLEKLLESNEHLLAAGGDSKLAASALAATKGIFDLALSLETNSHPHLHPFLVSILQPPSISLRSKAGVEEEADAPADPAELLPYTPLSVLTTDGMDHEQVWAQLELRADGICKIAKEVGSGDQEDEDAEDDDESEIEDDDSQEEMSVEEWNRMMAEEGYEEGESASEDEGSEDDDDEELGSDASLDFEDDEGVSLGEDEEGEEGEEDEEDEEDDEEDEDEEDEDGAADSDANPDVDMDGSDDDAVAAGPSKPRKKAKHSTLDDEFFSIDDFNRWTEEQEATHVTGGHLGGDDDEEAELDDIGGMFLEEGDEDAPLMYSDFFEPPQRSEPAPSKGKSRNKKGKSARFADEEEEQEEEEDVDETRETMSRVKSDLFEDSDDEEESEQNLSTHERRQRELAAQIAELEQEAIGPKDWTLLGEATSRARPENSLLEEHLDFEQVQKVVPVITEDTVATLEELIKKRILDNNFDSPVRVRAFEPTAFLPSRFFDLQDTKSTKSLAEIYEDEYQATAAGGKAADPRDEKLRKEHEEIDRLWNEVCYKLDALSSLNFVPKAPKAQITTIDNIATTSLETALPASQAATTMLAPQELFGGPKASELTARSEQTPEEAHAARAKARRAKKAQTARLSATAGLYGKKRQSVREQKDEAMKSLVKSGKGVTVVGKGEQEEAKRKRREENTTDSKRLKL